MELVTLRVVTEVDSRLEGAELKPSTELSVEPVMVREAREEAKMGKPDPVKLARSWLEVRDTAAPSLKSGVVDLKPAESSVLSRVTDEAESRLELAPPRRRILLPEKSRLEYDMHVPTSSD